MLLLTPPGHGSVGGGRKLGNFLSAPIHPPAPPPKPQCKSFYNLMYSMDPLAFRIEPLLAPEFSRIPAVCIPRLRAHTFVHEHLTASYQDRFTEKEEGFYAGADAPPLTSHPGSIPNPSLDCRMSEGESSARALNVPARRDKGERAAEARTGPPCLECTMHTTMVHFSYHCNCGQGQRGSDLICCNSVHDQVSKYQYQG